MEGGRQLGFEFVARDRTTITINMLGDEVSMCTAVRTSCMNGSAAEFVHLSVSQCARGEEPIEIRIMHACAWHRCKLIFILRTSRKVYLLLVYLG